MNKRYDKYESDSPEYAKGYVDGRKSAFEESELDAYYMGVGYGKKKAGDKHIGFSNPQEREAFEDGVQKKDRHFRSHRVEEPTFLERLLGVSERRKRMKKTKRSYEKQKRIDNKKNKSRTKYKRSRYRVK